MNEPCLTWMSHDSYHSYERAITRMNELWMSRHISPIYNPRSRMDKPWMAHTHITHECAMISYDCAVTRLAPTRRNAPWMSHASYEYAMDGNTRVTYEWAMISHEWAMPRMAHTRMNAPWLVCMRQEWHTHISHMNEPRFEWHTCTHACAMTRTNKSQIVCTRHQMTYTGSMGTYSLK